MAGVGESSTLLWCRETWRRPGQWARLQGGRGVLGKALLRKGLLPRCTGRRASHRGLGGRGHEQETRGRLGGAAPPGLSAAPSCKSDSCHPRRAWRIRQPSADPGRRHTAGPGFSLSGSPTRLVPRLLSSLEKLGHLIKMKTQLSG